MAHLAFIFCCFVWGTTFILLERVTHVFGPVEIGIWRMLSGAAVVGVVLVVAARRDSACERRDWVHMVLVALVFTAPPQVIQAYVLAQGYGHSFFGTMVAAIPLLTILVSVPMLGIVPTARELVGVLGGLACMWLIVEDGVHRGMSFGLLALTFVVPLSVGAEQHVHQVEAAARAGGTAHHDAAGRGKLRPVAAAVFHADAGSDAHCWARRMPPSRQRRSCTCCCWASSAAACRRWCSSG